MKESTSIKHMPILLKIVLGFLVTAAAVLLMVFAIKESCVLLRFADVNGTWIKADDYYDGFDPDDAYIEITAHGDFSFCGEYIGPASFSHEIGRYTVYDVNGPEVQWIFDSGFIFFPDSDTQLNVCSKFDSDDEEYYVHISESTGLSASQRRNCYS